MKFKYLSEIVIVSAIAITSLKYIIMMNVYDHL